MEVYVSNQEMLQIAEELVRRVCGKPPPCRVDIDAVAKYLGLTVRYEQFAEREPDKIGFSANGKSALTVCRNGIRTQVIFSKDTIVLDRFLLNSTEESRRRFTLSHEIGHKLLAHIDPTYDEGRFSHVYDYKRQYDISDLHERMNLTEWQSTFIGAAVLMPLSMIREALWFHMHRKSIPVYGEFVFLPSMKPSLRKMADELGVSHTAMVIQLKKYGLLKQYSMDEYFQILIEKGECL